MNKRMLWSRILCVSGMAITALGVAVFRSGGGFSRELTYALCMLSGSGMVAVSAFLSKSCYRALTFCALGLAVAGVPAWISYPAWSSTGRLDLVPWILKDPAVLLSFVGARASLALAIFALYWYLAPWAILTGGMFVVLESFHSSASTIPLEEVQMDRPRRWGPVMCALGLATILGGLAWQGGWNLEGRNSDFAYRLATHYGATVAVTTGAGIVALGAYLGRSRYRLFPYLAFVVAVADVTRILGTLLSRLQIVAPIGIIGALLVLMGFVECSLLAGDATPGQGARRSGRWRSVLLAGGTLAALGWTIPLLFSSLAFFWYFVSILSILLILIGEAESIVDLAPGSRAGEHVPLRTYTDAWLLGVATVAAAVTSLWFIGTVDF